MDIGARSGRQVDRELARLERIHGPFEVARVPRELPPEAYAWSRERFEVGTLGGAGVWLANDAGEVLLVREADGWSEPGGKHEPGETIEECARRELREETGLDCTLGAPALAQRVEIADETDPDRPAIHRLVVTFHGTHAGGDPRPGDDDIDAVQWCDSFPDRLRYDVLRRLTIPAQR